MKLRQGVVLAILLAAIPVLSACSAFGGGKSNQDSDYNRQVKAYQDAINANNKAQEEYNKNLQQGLQEYMDAYNKYSQTEQERMLQAQGIPFTVNQTQP
jgi:hypothetical protein